MSLEKFSKEKLESQLYCYFANCNGKRADFENFYKAHPTFVTLSFGRLAARWACDTYVGVRRVTYQGVMVHMKE